ncbi:Transcription factor NIGTH1 [Linum perenne]
MMSSVPAELSSCFDFRAMISSPSSKFVPNRIGDILRRAPTTMIGDADKSPPPPAPPRAESLLRELQEEMRRIDRSKLQLPLCMLLLNDAMIVVKESVQREKPLVLEEFIPLKKDEECKDNDSLVKAENDSCKDKKSWMSSVQLWSSDDTRLEQKANKKGDRCGNEDAFSASKNWSPVNLALKNVPKLLSAKEDGGSGRGEDLTAPGLSLLTPGIKNLSEESASTGSRATSSRGISSSAPNSQSSSHKGPIMPLQPCRKQRRCWSPELHRRFVNALQQLGGSQAATPKQIREIMQVDGLTNDEVKSHLQKYRLHTRRMTPPGSTPANQSLVVLGGLWMSQEQYGESSKAASSQSGSPQGPLQFGGTLMGGEDSMEDDDDDENDDDAKSENYSWKSLTPRSGRAGV